MRNIFRRATRDLAGVVGLALLAATAGLMASGQTAAQSRDPLSVLSFNIRYGTANDGENRWTNRQEFLFDVMRTENADVIGLQEALDSQVREIITALPAYGVIGVGRDDGRTRGEYAAILFRTDRFHVSDSGTFWFSDTPSVVASTSWGNTITRICTWARFVDRDGRGFWHFNVHLDHISQPSRERSTVLLAQRIAERRTPDEPVIVTGDFNVGEDNPAIATLLAPRAGATPLLVDTFRVRHPDETTVGTFSAFKAGQITGPKIDYILVSPGTDVLAAEIIRTSRDGRSPSDHFPVSAKIRLAFKNSP